MPNQGPIKSKIHTPDQGLKKVLVCSSENSENFKLMSRKFNTAVSRQFNCSHCQVVKFRSRILLDDWNVVKSSSF
jgi:hypothetical protein